jgi:hypothetical protein
LDGFVWASAEDVKQQNPNPSRGQIASQSRRRETRFREGRENRIERIEILPQATAGTNKISTNLSLPVKLVVLSERPGEKSTEQTGCKTYALCE